MRALGLLLVACAVCAACAGTPQVATSSDEVAAMRGRWLVAFNGKQLDAIAGTYAQDAVYVPITGNRIVSGLAIRNLYARIWERFTPHVDLEPHALERRGDLAYEVGDFREVISGVEGSLEVAGVYTMVYRREAAGWVIAVQVWTEHGGSTPGP